MSELLLDVSVSSAGACCVLTAGSVLTSAAGDWLVVNEVEAMADCIH